MLDLMLGNDPNAFSCGEVYAWFRPSKPHHLVLDCSCGQQPCPVWTRLTGVPEREFHAAATREPGIDTVVDSSKDLNWLLDTNAWGAERGFKVFNLFIWKSPVNHVYSYWKRGEDVSRWHREFHKYCARFLSTRLPFHTVSYESLVRDPQATLADVCKLVGLPYFSGKQRFWEETTHHCLFGSGAVRKQLRAGHSTIRANEPLPVDFLRLTERITATIQADARLQDILAAFASKAVSAGSTEGSVVGPRKPYPAWYYLRDVKRAIRRILPRFHSRPPGILISAAKHLPHCKS